MQKMHSDSDLESVPFSDSIFGRGGVTLNRRTLMIEPPYKVYGEDRKQSHSKSSRTTGEQNGKPIARSSGDGKAPKETTPSDRKTEVKDADTKKPPKVSEDKSSNELKQKSPSRPSTNGISDMSASDAKTTKLDEDSSTNTKQSENSSGSNKQNYNLSHPTVSFPEDVKKPPGGTSAAASQPRIDGEQTPISNPSTMKPGVEENIILGVALDGSKRTLPIEEDMPSSPQTTFGAKDMAAHWNGNGVSGARTPDKDTKRQAPSSPSTPSSE